MNVYDYPEFLDLTFRDETRLEADFIEEACKKYGRWPAERMLEPGCGGGRLIVELARRGHEMTGFDASLRALVYLSRQLGRRRRSAELFLADLQQFRLSRPVDAAFCTFNTFRHLTTEKQAVEHLQCVAQSLKRGGIYILGLHLLPLDVDETCVERWTAKHQDTQVTVTLRVLSANRKLRRERIRLSMLVRNKKGETRMKSEFDLRMYTPAQFRSLLRKVPEFELCDVFDFWYEIDRPLKLNDEITDTVVVLRKR
jgi:SAM-dependent methyltransferase